MSEINSIIEGLQMVEQDTSVPKNVRAKIKNAITILNNKEQPSLKIDKSLEELSDVADDPSIPSYTRMQIWSIVSQLESNK